MAAVIVAQGALPAFHVSDRMHRCERCHALTSATESEKEIDFVTSLSVESRYGITRSLCVKTPLLHEEQERNGTNGAVVRSSRT
jgi:hypothetical protein